MTTAFKIVGLILLIISVNLLDSCKKDKPSIPLVKTAEVTGISSSTAVSGGTITDDGGAAVTSRGVCWNTSDKPVIDDNKTSETGGSGTFTSNISQLTPNTTYYIRAYATNSAGTGYGNSLTLKTLGDKPSSAGVNATDVTTNSAVLRGTVNANSLSTTVLFEYGLTTSYGITSIAYQSPLSGAASGNVSTALSELTPGKTYHFRIKAENSLGIVYSDDMTFTTLGQLPSVTTLPAVDLQYYSAALNAEVNPNYLSTTVVFEWGLSSTYGSSIAYVQNPLTGSAAVLLSAVMTGLTPGTTYHFRVKAENNIGISVGSDMTFKTQIGVPVVTTREIDQLTNFTAYASGIIISDRGSQITEKGVVIGKSHNPTTSDYKVPCFEIQGVSDIFTSYLPWETPNTTYYIRAYAINTAGTGYGNELTTSIPDYPLLFNPSITYGTLSDIDNNTYKTVTIGTQIWMAENLRTTKFNDGTPVPLVTANGQWGNLTTPGYCYLNNDEGFKLMFGAIYNFYAVSTDLLCPTGWHVPSMNEITILQNNLGGESLAGGKIKETGTSHWKIPNETATNESGFTALPASMRVDSGPFMYLDGEGSGWWLSNAPDSYVFGATNNSAILQNYGYNVPKGSGLSVRCLKN